MYPLISSRPTTTSLAAFNRNSFCELWKQLKRPGRGLPSQHKQASTTTQMLRESEMDFTKRTSSYRNCVKEILLLATLAPLGAQPSARTVEGVVLDQHSHPVAHAAVQIENEWTLQVRSWITQADGRYHFAGLNGDGDYQITAEYDGLSATCES